MAEFPEVSPVTLELFFLCRSAADNRQQLSDSSGQLLLLQPWIRTDRASAAVYTGIGAVVIDTISIERAYCQSDHLKSV